jgi:hypothetical protein
MITFVIIMFKMWILILRHFLHLLLGLLYVKKQVS